MDSTLNDKAAAEPLTSLEEQLSDFARELEVSPSGPPTSIRAFRPPLATINRLTDWRHLALVGSVLAASIYGAAWWWSSSADTAMAPSPSPSPLTQTPPKDATPTAGALPSDLALQLQSMARDLAALRQAVEPLKVRQEQLVRDNENLASQLKASQAEMARNNDAIDRIKDTQIQMAREGDAITARLNASQEQLSRIIASASEPRVEAEEPRASPEQPTVSPEVPMPRPRQPTNVAKTHKSTPTPARQQANRPQPPAWPWSTR